MSGASIETTLELWASSLRDVKTRMRSLFKQERMAVSAGLLLDGLLGEERRKTGWMVQKRRVIPARGGSSRCWAAANGTRMRSGDWMFSSTTPESQVLPVLLRPLSQRTGNERFQPI